MDVEKICTLGRSVIEIEAQMIAALSSRIDIKFAQACLAIHQCQGKIAVMGVGKSGHIGKKIAATFASTGTPAFFIHPSEARHGDMGMLTHNDVLIAISYSGESEEVTSLLPSLKRLSIPLIALTGKSTSKLAQEANFYLDVSVEKEACPLGLAPTSSTTATLAMGDALAMAVLDMRAFSKDDFALSHPGGSLGKRLLLKVDSLMHKDRQVPIVQHNTSLKAALLEITQKKLGMTTVVDENGQLVGIFTDGDLRRAFKTSVNIDETPISHFMTESPKTIHSQLLAAEALNLMEDHKITALVVTDDRNQPTGIIHIHDILNAGLFV